MNEILPIQPQREAGEHFFQELPFQTFQSCASFQSFTKEHVHESRARAFARIASIPGLLSDNAPHRLVVYLKRAVQ